MYIYIYIDVYIYVCVHVYMCVHIYIYTCIWTLFPSVLEKCRDLQNAQNTVWKREVWNVGQVVLKDLRPVTQKSLVWGGY